MPDDKKEETSELDELRSALAQREGQLSMVLQEKAALEELVMNGPAMAEIARQTNKGKEKEEEHVEEKPSGEANKVDPKALAEATVKAATRTAEEVTRHAIETEKQKVIATNLFNTDPQFKLYIEEIKHFSRLHPTLSVQDAYDMARKAFPDKKEAPSREEPKRTRDVGQIRDVREEGSRDRFSGVPKARNPEDKQSIYNQHFDSAIEAGLKASGLG